MVDHSDPMEFVSQQNFLLISNVLLLEIDIEEHAWLVQ